MRRTLTAAAVAAALTLTVANPAAAKGPKPADGTIVDTAIAVNAPGGAYEGLFDEVLFAATALELAPVLDTKRNFTLFAPTDQAFADLAAVLGVTDADGDGLVAGDLVAALGAETVTEVLLYHVAPGSRDSVDVTSSTQINTLLKGEKIPMFTDAGVIDEADPVLLDVEVSNGYIHVIDAVLLPSYLS